MSKKIIIDGTYSKNTRVACIENGILQEFDFDLADRDFLRGNIYLAKVVRIESALQAAFVDFGYGRNGFLPFSEIHPDYYQIPTEDRNEIISQMRDGDSYDGDDQDSQVFGKKSLKNNKNEDNQPEEDEESEQVEKSGNERFASESGFDIKKFESIIRKKKFKIGEVIKKEQLMLVQVLKEERGNKGATLTTYISLAGRFLVFMPNSLKGNGISRKISDASERKKIKNIFSSFTLPTTSAIVARTAAEGVPETQIKKDYEYLAELWNSIRAKTLKSSAPSFIHEEDNILKRSIREYYDNQVKEIIVEGEDCYKKLQEYVSNFFNKDEVNIQLYNEKQPIFVKFGIENQVSSLFGSKVPLKSGGSLVINQTEALIAIDINSGKTTSEHNIEETAIKTNIEAADEIARQLRLRNLSGLIVVDFIDMVKFSNRKMVERHLKEILSKDRVRVQIGRISQFGLLEISRQRTRPTFIESVGVTCGSCSGVGFTKSLEYLAINLFRSLADALRERSSKPGVSAKNVELICSTNLCQYILNYKKFTIKSIEESFNIKVFVSSGKTSDDNKSWVEFYESPKCNENTIETSESGAFNIKPTIGKNKCIFSKFLCFFGSVFCCKKQSRCCSGKSCRS